MIELRGSWGVAGKTDPLSLGGGVPAGGIIRLRTAGSDASISVALLNGKYLSMRCQAAASEACIQGLQIPATFVEGASGVRGVVQSVMDVLLDRSPAANRFSPTIIRTARVYKRDELMVQLESGKAVSLGDALSGVQSGNYTLEWSDVTGASTLEQTPIRWDSRDGEPMIPIRVAGLYSIRLINDYREPVLDIALLAVSPNRAKSISESFQHARQMCATWSGPDALDSQHDFLRAYLIALAVDVR